MRNNEEIWELIVPCTGCAEDHYTGCNSFSKLHWDDIDYTEVMCLDGYVRGFYSYNCPVCQRKTYLELDNEPEFIRNLIMSNNGYDSRLSVKKSKVFKIK